MTRRWRAWGRWLAVGLLLVMWGRLLATTAQKSVTFDEIIHILHGVMYWQYRPLLSVVQNPPLVNALMGLPVSLAFHPALPLGSPLWGSNDWLRISQFFAWQANANGLQMIFAARLVVMGLALALGALLYVFATRLWRDARAGVVALLLVSVDPNVLAHGFLATTDVGTALFLTLAVFLCWRYWQAPGRGRFLLAGVGVGLALASKFSAVVLLPAILLVGLYRARQEAGGRGERMRTAVFVTLGWTAVGALLFLLLYRFDLAALAQDFAQQRAHQLEGHSAFLLGEVNGGGWWYYFPLIFLLKTPVAVLLLFAWGVGWLVWRRPRAWTTWWLLLPVGGLFAAALLSRVNIGYRYLLPVLPLLYLVVAPCVVRAAGRAQWAAYVLLFLAVSVSLRQHPHYLAYFNELAGGSAEGWRVAVDSNLDWGQDVQALAEAQRLQGWPRLYANWLGSAPPEAYGLEAALLPGWPWRPETPRFDAFYPDRPGPGAYALSATQLQGPYLDDPDLYAWFRTREPTARVGYSFFVYEVAPEGAPTAVALSGIGLKMIAPADYALFGGNDVRPLWYDARTSFVWPGARSWLAVGDGEWPPPAPLSALYDTTREVRGARALAGTTWRYRLLPAAGPPSQQIDFMPAGTTAVFGDTLQLLGHRPLWSQRPTAGSTLELLTLWRVAGAPTHELKAFVHLVDASGNLVAQHDGLDVLASNLQAGDEIVQLHQIPLPADLPPGSYTLRAGLYDPETGVRLLLDGSGEDSRTLGDVAVGP